MPNDAHNHNDSHGHDNPSPIPDSGRLYETRDVAPTMLIKWVAFLFVFVGGASVVTLGLYKFFVPNGEEKTQFPLTYERQLPPGPRLQANPVEDIKEYRAIEANALNSYGRDLRTGAIHIPVDVAMDLTLADLPTRPGAGPIDIHDTTAPNTPSRFNGQYSDGASARPNTNGMPMGAEQPGGSPSQPDQSGQPSQPDQNTPQSTEPTSNAPGNSSGTSPGMNMPTGGMTPIPVPGSTQGGNAPR